MEHTTYVDYATIKTLCVAEECKLEQLKRQRNMIYDKIESLNVDRVNVSNDYDNINNMLKKTKNLQHMMDGITASHGAFYDLKGYCTSSCNNIFDSLLKLHIPSSVMRKHSVWTRSNPFNGSTQTYTCDDVDDNGKHIDTRTYKIVNTTIESYDYKSTLNYVMCVIMTPKNAKTLIAEKRKQLERMSVRFGKLNEELNKLAEDRLLMIKQQDQLVADIKQLSEEHE